MSMALESIFESKSRLVDMTFARSGLLVIHVDNYHRAFAVVYKGV